MNYKKIILVGIISAFVAVLTSVLGVAGTVIGSVISSVLYNALSEALEEPVSHVSFKKSNFEWDIAYVFPLVVIAIIQLILIFALLAEHGILPANFLIAYLSLQQLANNNLYRILGVALLVMSVYPFVLKPEHVNKIHGGAIAFVGLIFLARGLVDLGNAFTSVYDVVFAYFDFPIAIIAFVMLAVIIFRILSSARKARLESETVQEDEKGFNHKVYYQNPNKADTKRYDGHVDDESKYSKPKGRFKYNRENIKNQSQEVSHRFKSRLDEASKTRKSKINESHNNIRFESNDLLDEYKK